MIEKKEVEYAAQLDDVMVLVKEIVKTIKEKGNYTMLLDDLIAAVNGIDEIDDEYRANAPVCINTVLSRAVEIGFLFAKKEEVAAV